MRANFCKHVVIVRQPSVSPFRVGIRDQRVLHQLRGDVDDIVMVAWKKGTLTFC